MNNHTLTPNQKQTLSHLVMLRFVARKLMKTRESQRQTMKAFEGARQRAIKNGNTKAEASLKIDIDDLKEIQLDIDFRVIELGQAFMQACGHYDQLPRDVWLRALSVNESEWSTPMMREHGQSISHVVVVLGLENSATNKDEDYSVTNKPLHWCCTMAMLNTSHTNPKMGKAMHDITNEFFGGGFGEWREPTIMERMGVSHTC